MYSCSASPEYVLAWPKSEKSSCSYSPRKHMPFVVCHPSYKSMFSWPRNDSFLGFLPSLPDLMQELTGLDLNLGRNSPIITWCIPGSRKLFQGRHPTVIHHLAKHKGRGAFLFFKTCTATVVYMSEPKNCLPFLTIQRRLTAFVHDRFVFL